jgi:hypothetical protein
MNKKYNFYAEGGSLGNHGLKQGDQIIKTMSGGVQKVKTRSGDIVYVNLANGYRGAEPPLPFAKGGGVRKVGNREYSTGRNWTNDHRHVNKSEQHEVNYNRRNSLFFAGGGEIRRFDRQAQMDSKTREEILDVLSESDTPKVLTNYLYGLFDGYDYSETANFKKEVEFLKRKNPKLHQRVVDIYKKIDNYKFEKYEDNYATGGVTKNYINRSQLNTITIKKGDQKLTYKVSDVYNGAYKLEDGGNLEKTAFYVPKRNVVKVQLRDGRDVKVANGYWIKKGAKPIRASKFEDGGQLEIKFAGGGKIETKIQKKIDEVNALIEKAIDSDGDPLMVVDTTGTWEEPMQYKPIVYKNGRLYIEYFEPYSGKTEKDVINKSNVDFDGYPTLLNIAKMYRKALKEKGISYAGGGKTTFKEKSTAIAKNFEGKKVKPKYQKEYGKTYDKAEAKEVGNKIAGSQKAKYDSKMSGGGTTKRGGAMVLAKQIRKEGESWASALKRANEQMKNK